MATKSTRTPAKKTTAKAAKKTTAKVAKKSATTAKPTATRTPTKKTTRTRSASPQSKGGSTGQPVLLSGGNPQIPKGDGDAPVQAYIAAMPGWKSEAGRRLDALIERTVPGVKKAVKWNSPFYGVEGKGWFLSYHCFTKYIKVAFFQGKSLDPLPPVDSKDPNARYFHVYENDPLDEKLVAKWIRQASKLPGWIP